MEFIILGKKLAMYSGLQKYDAMPVSVIDIEDATIAKKFTDKQGNFFVLVGYGKKKHPTKPEQGVFKDLSYVPERVIQVKVEKSLFDALKVGDKLYTALADYLKPGAKVHVSGTSKGKGFAGVIKRHGFSRQPKTHGQSDRERAPGAIGAQTPGRVWKGKKMPGRMGNQRVTVRNLKFVDLLDIPHKQDATRKAMIITGSVPGTYGALVEIRFNIESK